jgi:hypothetical protein
VTGFSPDIGTTADAAWSGTGNASLIAIGKATYGALLGPPNLNVNGANQPWTGVTVGGAAQTGTVYASNMDLTSSGGVALGAMANYGTSPGAVKALGVNAAITNTPTLGAGSAIIGKTGVDQTTPGTTNGVALVGVNGATALAGAGAVGTGSARVAVGQDTTTIAGSAPVKGGVPTVNGASTYNTVAASTNATLSSTNGGTSGTTGDYLSHCVITPGTTSPGTAIIYDNSTAIYTFAGGTSSVSTLISWAVPVGAVSVSGAWKISTGANVTVFCTGKFT